MLSKPFGKPTELVLGTKGEAPATSQTFAKTIPPHRLDHRSEITRTHATSVTQLSRKATSDQEDAAALDVEPERVVVLPITPLPTPLYVRRRTKACRPSRFCPALRKQRRALLYSRSCRER